jgi:hypothetical protein
MHKFLKFALVFFQAKPSPGMTKAETQVVDFKQNNFSVRLTSARRKAA